MTKRQFNKRTMYQSVLGLVETNNTSASSFQGIAESVQSFKDVVLAIESKDVEVQFASTGKAIARREAQNKLMAILVPVQAAVYAFAEAQKDGQLKAKASTAPSRLFLMRDVKLADVASGVLTLARENAQNLADHGVGAESIDRLEASIEGFKKAIEKAESGAAVRKAARKSAEELIAEADAILSEKIDKYAELLREGDPQFYDGYFEARMVKNAGIRHRHEAANVIPAAVQQAPAKAA